MAMVCAISVCGLAQDRGDFTRAPGEYVTNELERPFLVRSVAGQVSCSGIGVGNVLVEIPGPGQSKKIRQATTDRDGRFRLGHVPLGFYRFKASLHGFQGVLGAISVSKSAAASSEILIQIKPSV